MGCKNTMLVYATYIVFCFYKQVTAIKGLYSGCLPPESCIGMGLVGFLQPEMETQAKGKPLTWGLSLTQYCLLRINLP